MSKISLVCILIGKYDMNEKYLRLELETMNSSFVIKPRTTDEWCLDSKFFKLKSK